MSIGVKFANAAEDLVSHPGQVALSAAFWRHGRQVLLTGLFLLLVALGSVWAVYTMQYYDDLGAAARQGNGAEVSHLATPN